MSSRFSNKTALVTGAGSGIGQIIAQQLAAEGAQVIIFDLEETGLQETAALHPNISYHVADITDSTALKSIINDIQQRFGKLDILVNNAGVAPVAALADVNIDEIDSVFAINVRGVIVLTQLALPLLKIAQGNIVNITSSAATDPLANMSVYSASKAALHALTVSWAKDLAKDNIRVNSVAPGPIWTAIYEKTALDNAGIQAHIQRVTELTPLHRFGKPIDVAKVVSFLASDEANFVTGGNYSVDGGIGI